MAVGLSRTIEGKVIPSERPGHMMLENWNPLGKIGVISAFNFPVAVSGWNTAIALIGGNQVVWKGAPSVSLSTIATGKIVGDVLKDHGFGSVFTVCHGDGENIGEKMLHDERLPLVSFTGSSKVGQHASKVVHERFGRTILELGGNNASIILEDADLDMAMKGSVFAAAGTCGQRCTSLRRLLIQEPVFDQVVSRLVKAYSTIKIGNPLDTSTLVGPLHSKQQV